MKRKPAIYTFGAMVVFVAVIAGVKVTQMRAAMAKAATFQPPPVAVTTTVAERERWPITLRAVGSVVASQGVTVSADLPGVVQTVAFESGQKVKKGDLLVQLDVDEERAQLASARSSLKLAEIDRGRIEQLYAQGVAAQQERDQLRAQQLQASAMVRQIGATIARKRITAPFSGTLGIRRVNLGQYLAPGDAIVALSVLDPIYVDFSVPQQQLARMQNGAEVHATTQHDEEGLTGRITALDAMVDEQTRNVTVRATFANPDGTLRPGMFVGVEVRLGEGPAQITLPASAINHAPFGDSVYVVDELQGQDGESYQGVRMQFVELGHTRDDRVAVVSGIAPGDEVVTTGVFKLRPSAPVQVDNSVSPAEELTAEREDGG